MPPWGIVGRIVLAYVHSQMNPQRCTTFGANRSNVLTASQYFWICDPLSPPHRHAPGVLRGDLYLAYTHSQMNPQMWTKVGANRSSRLTAFPDLWLFDPLIPHKCPSCVSRGNLFGVYPFPDESTNLVPIGPVVWIFSWFLNLWPPNPPCRGENCIWPMFIPRRIRRRVPNLAPIGQPFDSLPDFWFVTP